MDLENVRIFLDVIKSGSITAAANHHYISQPALGKRLHALEKELGVELLSRGKGQAQIKVTPAGKAFTDIAERMLLLYDQAMAIKNTGNRIYLTAACIRSAHREVFPPLLTYLKNNYPEICLTIEDHHTAEIIPLLENHRIDVGITQIPVLSQGIISELLYEEPYTVILHPDSPYPPDVPLAPQKLQVSHGIFQSFDSEFQNWFEQNWSIPDLKMRVTSNATAELYFDEPEDWMIAPLAVAREMRRSGFLSCPLLAAAPPHRVYLNYNKFSEDSAVRIFIEYTKSLFPKFTLSANDYY